MKVKMWIVWGILAVLLVSLGITFFVLRDRDRLITVEDVGLEGLYFEKILEVGFEDPADYQNPVPLKQLGEMESFLKVFDGAVFQKGRAETSFETLKIRIRTDQHLYSFSSKTVNEIWVGIDNDSKVYRINFSLALDREMKRLFEIAKQDSAT